MKLSILTISSILLSPVFAAWSLTYSDCSGGIEQSTYDFNYYEGPMSKHKEWYNEKPTKACNTGGSEGETCTLKGPTGSDWVGSIDGLAGGGCNFGSFPASAKILTPKGHTVQAVDSKKCKKISYCGGGFGGCKTNGYMCDIPM